MKPFLDSVILSCFPAKTESEITGINRVTLFIIKDLLTSMKKTGRHRKNNTPKSIVIKNSEVYIVINWCSISAYS
jgi:hypothetical protein